MATHETFMSYLKDVADVLDMTLCTEMISGNFGETIGSEEITHILCGAVEEEVSCDTWDSVAY